MYDKAILATYISSDFLPVGGVEVAARMRRRYRSAFDGRRSANSFTAARRASLVGVVLSASAARAVLNVGSEAGAVGTGTTAVSGSTILALNVGIVREA